MSIDVTLATKSGEVLFQLRIDPRGLTDSESAAEIADCLTRAFIVTDNSEDIS